MGAVVPAYNLEKVKQPITLDGPVLADIYLGNIKKWNDEPIKKLNPDVDLPSEEIKVVHRDDASGTSYIWTDYLSKVSPEWKKKVGAGVSVDWPAGEGATGNDGVAAKIKDTPVQPRLRPAELRPQERHPLRPGEEQGRGPPSRRVSNP